MGAHASAREFSKVLRALPIHFGIVAPLGLAGILFTRRRTPVPGRRREGAIALALLLLFALGCNLRSPLLVAQTKNRAAFYDFAVLFERGGDLGRAEAMLRRSLAIDPRFPPALVALAGVEAPDYPMAHSNLALVLESQGRITDAIGEYRRTLELEPTHVRAQRALARLAVH